MLRKGFHFRMRDAESCAKLIRTSEYDQRHVNLYILPNPFDALEPDEFHLSGIVHKSRHESRAAVLSDSFYMCDFPDYLNFGACVTQFGYFVVACAVNVAVREDAKQVAVFCHAQFLAQKLGPLRTDAFKEFYGSFEEGQIRIEDLRFKI